MRRPLTRPQGLGSALLWDLLTFERLMTNQVIHLIYWAGLAIIVLGVFGTIGAAVGVAIRDPSLFGKRDDSLGRHCRERRFTCGPRPDAPSRPSG